MEQTVRSGHFLSAAFDVDSLRLQQSLAQHDSYQDMPSGMSPAFLLLSPGGSHTKWNQVPEGDRSVGRSRQRSWVYFDEWRPHPTTNDGAPIWLKWPTTSPLSHRTTLKI